ncbi:hypothetical protein OIO90_005566 [Microbotryomycetes sp. JL221]|nr:hypothetical protein OIO90_005566 [Microbotryomycetes sp. JL221]
MGLLSVLRPWSRRSTSTDYETILSRLEQDINKAESHLLQIKLRERRSNALFLTYGITVWLLYFGVWYLYLRHNQHSTGQLVVVTLPLIVGPVLLVFTRRFVRSFYRRQQTKEETNLRSLKKQQRAKVEELKRNTGYYSTKTLIDKYDDEQGSNKQHGIESTTTKGGIKAQARSNATKPPPQQQQQQQQNQSQQQQATSPLIPLAPSAVAQPPRTFMDKVADALIGTNNEQEPFNKYALICSKCYNHNGLVPKEEFETIQYQCPRCGFMNLSRQTLAQQAAMGTTSAKPEARDNLAKTTTTTADQAKVLSDANVGGGRGRSSTGEEQDDQDSTEVETLLSTKPTSSNEAKLRQRTTRGPDDMDMD